MKRENFYRRDPMAALNGMIGMSLEERAVYNVVIDLLYSTWRPIEDNRQFIARWCECAVQRLNPIIAKLIEKGKLKRIEEGGCWYLTNARFEAERTAVKGTSTARKGRPENREVGEKSGEVGEKSAGVGQTPPLLDRDIEENQPVTALDKTREDKTRDSVPNGTGGEPPSGDDQVIAELRGLEPKRRAWALAKRVLVDRGKLTEARAGEIVGKWARDHKFSPDELWAVAEAAWRAGTEAPVAYMAKALGEAALRRTSDIDAPNERQQTAWMEDWAESPASWKRHQRGPKPGEEGCRVAPDIQRRFGATPFGEPSEVGAEVLPFPCQPRSAA